jgi:methylmalonyl-CoA mutase
MRRPWTHRQYAGFSTAESNAFIDVILLQDKRTINCFRLPTHRGVMIQITNVVGDVGKQELPLTL